ncbi:uncharacterized protein [Centruroides vittatus]|uniref:uncharacterized protein n=1 Tax=Centruroides vittatus TaxID=120091 RepID=UPI00350F8783
MAEQHPHPDRRSEMLRYLTHKLRTQSLNEGDPPHSKVDDDHDCQATTYGCYMLTLICCLNLMQFMESDVQSPGDKKQAERSSSNQEVITDSAENSERQQHSGASKTEVDSPILDTALDSALPSDSDHNCDHRSSEEELEVINSADVVQEKMTKMRDLVCISAPVEFRSSPPANVPKPSRSLSPPPKLFHSSVGNIPPLELCSVSPRKRHRHIPNVNTSTNLQRPCLDFEKIQQTASF